VVGGGEGGTGVVGGGEGGTGVVGGGVGGSEEEVGGGVADTEHDACKKVRKWLVRHYHQNYLTCVTVSIIFGSWLVPNRVQTIEPLF
jgi:hypothetical protein